MHPGGRKAERTRCVEPGRQQRRNCPRCEGCRARTTAAFQWAQIGFRFRDRHAVALRSRCSASSENGSSGNSPMCGCAPGAGGLRSDLESGCFLLARKRGAWRVIRKRPSVGKAAVGGFGECYAFRFSARRCRSGLSSLLSGLAPDLAIAHAQTAVCRNPPRRRKKGSSAPEMPPPPANLENRGGGA